MGRQGMKGRREVISRWIRNDKHTEKEAVSVVRYGDLAIARIPNPDGWCVLHVPTGKAVGTGMPKRSQALELLMRLLPYDWDWTDEKDAPANIRVDVPKIVQEYRDE